MDGEKRTGGEKRKEVREEKKRRKGDRRIGNLRRGKKERVATTREL